MEIYVSGCENKGKRKKEVERTFSCLIFLFNNKIDEEMVCFYIIKFLILKKLGVIM